MKRLYILRHAQTFPSSGSSDLERTLMPQGQDDALALGETMKAQKFLPDFILCSPATRTRQTLDQVLQILGKIPSEYPKAIYDGGHSELVKLLRSVDDQYAAVMLVGHNPAIHQLAASLTHEDGNPLINRLAAGYAPGTLTVLDVPRASWRDLQLNENKLVDLIEP